MVCYYSTNSGNNGFIMLSGIFHVKVMTNRHQMRPSGNENERRISIKLSQLVPVSYQLKIIVAL